MASTPPPFPSSDEGDFDDDDDFGCFTSSAPVDSEAEMDDIHGNLSKANDSTSSVTPDQIMEKHVSTGLELAGSSSGERIRIDKCEPDEGHGNVQMSEELCCDSTNTTTPVTAQLESESVESSKDECSSCVETSDDTKTAFSPISVNDSHIDNTNAITKDNELKADSCADDEFAQQDRDDWADFSSAVSDNNSAPEFSNNDDTTVKVVDIELNEPQSLQACDLSDDNENSPKTSSTSPTPVSDEVSPHGTALDLEFEDMPENVNVVNKINNKSLEESEYSCDTSKDSSQDINMSVISENNGKSLDEMNHPVIDCDSNSCLEEVERKSDHDLESTNESLHDESNNKEEEPNNKEEESNNREDESNKRNELSINNEEGSDNNEEEYDNKEEESNNKEEESIINEEESNNKEGESDKEEEEYDNKDEESVINEEESNNKEGESDKEEEESDKEEEESDNKEEESDNKEEESDNKEEEPNSNDEEPNSNEEEDLKNVQSIQIVSNQDDFHEDDDFGEFADFSCHKAKENPQTKEDDVAPITFRTSICEDDDDGIDEMEAEEVPDGLENNMQAEVCEQFSTLPLASENVDGDDEDWGFKAAEDDKTDGDDFGDFGCTKQEPSDDADWADFSDTAIPSTETSTVPDDTTQFDAKEFSSPVRTIASSDGSAQPGQSKLEKAVTSCFPQASVLQHSYQCNDEIDVETNSTNTEDVKILNALDYIIEMGLAGLPSAKQETWTITKEIRIKNPMVGIWEHLKDVDACHALGFGWNASQCSQDVYNTLHIDTKNVLFSQKKQAVPFFASGLGILEPIRGGSSQPAKQHTPPIPTLVDTESAEESQKVDKEATQDIPPVDFDWSSSGLTDPLKVFKSDTFNTGLSSFEPLAEILQRSAAASQDSSEKELSPEAAGILSKIPNLSFMQSKVLMFPIKYP